MAAFCTSVSHGKSFVFYVFPLNFGFDKETIMFIWIAYSIRFVSYCVERNTWGSWEELLMTS